MIWRRTPTPCCYTDANGSSCHCHRRKDAEAAIATARADALREALEAIDAIPEAGSADFNMGVSRAYVSILALISQEPKP